MSEVTLKFKLPEEAEDARASQDGSAWKNVAWEIDMVLRSMTKHAPDSMTKETYDALQKVREDLYEIVSANGLVLDY